MTTSPTQGLSSREAARRLAQIGPNAVVEPHLSPAVRIARRFWEPVPWMLEAAIVLQLAIGERVEALIIAVLLIFNVALGVFQEGRAGEALAALKSKLALNAFVKRDGKWVAIPAAGLVPGDIVRLALGGVVPADARVLDGSVLLDQSMLTGESVAVEIGAGKTAYASALVRRGAATAEITATGQHTYFGKTAELVRIAHAESGEQKAVLGVVRNLAVLNGAVVVLLVTYAHSIAMPVNHMIPLVLTALLASVPVALPATFTLAAALSAQALTKKGVLLTRLSAIHEAVLAKGSAILQCKVLRFTPFDPATKTSEALIAGERGEEQRIVKGAPSAIAAIAPFEAGATAELDKLMGQGYRVLAVAGGPPPPPQSWD